VLTLRSGSRVREVGLGSTMATSVDAYGVVCRVLTYSSLTFGALNQMTLELSTPYSVNPNGACAQQGFCRGRW
jgi:hypothetical protein